MNVLLDTNVVLDALLQRAVWQDAMKIIVATDKGEITTCITAS